MDRETRSRHRGQTRAAAEARAVGTEEPGLVGRHRELLEPKTGHPITGLVGVLGNQERRP